MKRTYDDTMFIDTFEHEYTYLNGFMRNVRRYSRHIAVLDPETEREFTYTQVNVSANKLAHALEKQDVGKNDVVMTALRNCPEFVYTYLGPRKIGAIVLPANFNLSAGELALLIDFNKPKTFIYSANIAAVAAEAMRLSKNPPMKAVLADNLEGVEIPEGHISYEEFTEGEDENDPVQKVRPHIYDEVIRFCTSGTTALPKSVPVNDINDLLSAHDVIMQYGLTAIDKTVNMTPWFHRGGTHCGGMGPTIYAGAAAVVVRAFDAKKILEWTEKYGFTYLTGAPSSLEMLARVQERKHFNISSLRGIATMGAPLERAACIRYQEVLTPNIFNGYGTTETDWNSLLHPFDLPDEAGSIGPSAVDDEIRVVKIYEDHKAEPDELIPTDSVTQGEVIIQAPQKTTYSYYNNEELAKEKFYKGWMYTGDTATWNDKWIVTICGRKDDMMVVSGENIYPSQIEEVINENPKVLDCIVTAVPDKDKYRGQVAAAYIIPADKSLTIAEIKEFCNQHPMLSDYKKPRYYTFTDKIPMTATGKKMHHVIKEQAKKDLEEGILKRK
ncbi:MAG: acyl--CoA ligase [Lachnospiraceae bacterium]|nr:acyl--CoA ligase [Lachnospiraceae bacterium]